jgi:hypothetical protein
VPGRFESCPEEHLAPGFKLESMAKRLFILSIVVLGFLIIRDWDSGPVVHTPGVLVAEIPLQRNLQPTGFMIDDYRVTRKASFEIRARVLSTERYFMNREGELSPIDLALGWGPMSDQAVLDQLEISQSGRWFRWRYENSPPVPEQQIIVSSGNMHMIPANSGIERDLKKLRRGDIVRLKGFLVDVDHDSGWHWRSSMTRNDSGDGACELVYVESLDVEISG